MVKEVERKFLVEDGSWRENADPGTPIRQFYLAVGPDRSVRVRIKNEAAARLTLKFGGPGAARDEYEYDIPLEQAAQMQAFALGTVIEKTRHLVEHHHMTFEVDVFGGRLDGLILAELEGAEHRTAQDLPDWLGREVTEDPAYYNASLAMNGWSVST
jgi:adenylate cyclase